MEILFWVALSTLIYIYLGYPTLLAILAAIIEPKPIRKGDITPSVTIIIAAHNEEQVIGGRIENCFALDYPQDMLEIIIASDGSTDRTNEIVEGYADRNSNVKLLAFKEQRGRASVHHDAVKEAKGDFIVFTDAETEFTPSCLKQMMKDFADPKVGCVSGQIRYLVTPQSGSSQSEAFYYNKFELLIWEKESDLGIAFSGSGPFMAVRKELYEPFNPAFDVDDIIPLRCRKKGYRVVREVEAVCYDKTATSRKAELRRRIRMGTQVMGGTIHELISLKLYLHPSIFIPMLSHKLLRCWTPLFLIIVFISSLFLLNSTFYQVLFLLQLVFYGSALVGIVVSRIGREITLFSLTTSFCLANIAFLVSIFNVIRGKGIPVYTPTAKQ